MIAERRDDRGMSIEVGLQLVEKRIDGRLMSDAFSDSSRAENAVRSTVWSRENGAVRTSRGEDGHNGKTTRS